MRHEPRQNLVFGVMKAIREDRNEFWR